MQRATGPRLLRDHLQPAGLEPRLLDRKSSTLTTWLSRHLSDASESRTSGIVVADFLHTMCLSYHPTDRIKTLKKTQIIITDKIHLDIPHHVLLTYMDCNYEIYKNMKLVAS